ncbi:outer membrane protein [Aliihoeflea sp. PC F10.4]
MKSINVAALAVAGIIAIPAVPALAADIYQEPVYKDYIPEQPVAFGGWYLRGHIGMSNQRFKGLDYFRYDDPAIDVIWLDKGGFGSAPIFGGGIGYQFNDWFRTDVTAEYRGKSNFTALDRITAAGDPDTIFGINDYRAKKSEVLLLANVYADLGKYAGLSPYIGAGIGASRNTISGFNDSNIFTGGGGYADSNSQWELAWALHAGVSYDLTERAAIDFGYSYTFLGDGQTGPGQNYDPSFTVPNDGWTFKDLQSHDLKLGFRYKFN